jgi:hypothetical protein
MADQDQKHTRAIRSIERLRDRLFCMVNGDTTVDIGTLLYQLNKDVVVLGGSARSLDPSDIKPRFFVEVDR